MYRLSENTKDVDFVILSEAKNLIITIGYTARFFGSSLGMTILGQPVQRPENIKEGFYKKFGFKKMETAMAVFSNQDRAKKHGLIE